MPTATSPRRIAELLSAVDDLRGQCLRFEEEHQRALAATAASSRNSARNLLHYLGLRQNDLRRLQQDLAALGLSSLGRLEAHALATLEAVQATLQRLAGRPAMESASEAAPVDFQSGPALLADHAARLLGPEPDNRKVRIMVTMPSAAAEDESVIRDLVAAGMSVMRINCAHDHPDAWSRMIENLRRAESSTGRKCPILADLAGPKLRTGPVAAGERIVHLNPKRDSHGRVTAPLAVWLTPAIDPEPNGVSADATLPLLGDILEKAAGGDRLRIRDCQGGERVLDVAVRLGRSLCARTDQPMSVPEDAVVVLEREGGVVARGRVGALPSVATPIVLRRGDRLVLTREGVPGGPARIGLDGAVEAPAHIACSLDAAFRCAKPGEHVWLDDGKIGGILRDVSADEMIAEITFAAAKGSRLRAEKGINLPDTALDVPSLSEKDLADLAFMAGRVDMVALSFVRKPEDVVQLQDRIAALGAENLGVVLKIENQAAFERLPDLLLAGLRSRPVGVMVARGDLAVEVGFERLAEVQEEILCLCEAAHTPVIWATQVLADMARTGMPSRAEVTDAAMSVRAECVMLNKGPHIVEAVAFLAQLLARMGDHQAKKKPMMPQLLMLPPV